MNSTSQTEFAELIGASLIRNAEDREALHHSALDILAGGPRSHALKQAILAAGGGPDVERMAIAIIQAVHDDAPPR